MSIVRTIRSDTTLNDKELTSKINELEQELGSLVSVVPMGSHPYFGGYLCVFDDGNHEVGA